MDTICNDLTEPRQNLQKTKTRSTWFEYLDSIKAEVLEPNEPQLKGLDSFLNSYRFIQPLFMQSIPFIYIVDYRNGLFKHMSENFGGYRAASFLEEGINHSLDIYHPKHLSLFNKEIFPDRLAILEGIDPKEFKNHIFSFNLTIRNRNGQYEHFMQRSCFLPDAEGNPVLNMGMLFSVDHLNCDSPIVQTVIRINPNDPAEHTVIHKKTYHFPEENKLFSKREVEILQWIAEGHTSKMIAEKLFLSEHTVIAHKKNMQRKAGVSNAAALIYYAIKKNVI